MALRGRRCSSPRPRRRRHPARTPQTLGAMSDLRGSNPTEDFRMLDSSRGPGALSLRGRIRPRLGRGRAEAPARIAKSDSLLAGQPRKIKRQGVPTLPLSPGRNQRCSSPGPRRRLDQKAVKEGWEEIVRQHRRIGKRRRRCWRPIGWRADTAAPVNIDPISCLEQPAKPALCGFSGRKLLENCLQSRRGWRDNYRHCGTVRATPTAKGRNW
jgi:hypothetical protein